MIRTIAVFAALGLTGAAHAGPDDFSYGPVFDSYGRVADIPDAEALPADTVLRVAFDIAEGAEPGEVSRRIDSAARFINMHVANGVPEDNIQVAVVVHGKAGLDLLSNAAWRAKMGEDAGDNPDQPMVRAMLDQGVRFILCGQSAAAFGINAEDLEPGVEMALSAMTAHALLQQRGYTVNPF